jgi:hypothetical protein
MQDWVDEHPPGTSIAVHYNPADPEKAILTVTDMPLGGLRTPSNVRLLGFTATICALLLGIARLARPSSGAGQPC